MARCIEAYGRVLMHMPVELRGCGSVFQCVDGLFEIAVRACEVRPVNLTPGTLYIIHRHEAFCSRSSSSSGQPHALHVYLVGTCTELCRCHPCYEIVGCAIAGPAFRQPSIPVKFSALPIDSLKHQQSPNRYTDGAHRCTDTPTALGPVFPSRAGKCHACRLHYACRCRGELVWCPCSERAEPARLQSYLRGSHRH